MYGNSVALEPFASDPQWQRWSHCLALLRVSLIVGRLSRQDMLDALQGSGTATHLLALLQSEGLGVHPMAEKLAAAVVSVVLNPAGLTPDAVQDALPALVDMVKADDAVARTVVGMLADLAKSNPAAVFGHISGCIDGEDSRQRKNGLRVLDMLLDDASLSPRFKAAATQHMLKRLSDDDVGVRNVASKLFCFVDPLTTVPILADRLSDRDDRVRSAAERALRDMLSRHGDPTFVFTTMVGALQRGSVLPPPTNPGQIGQTVGLLLAPTFPLLCYTLQTIVLIDKQDGSCIVFASIGLLQPHS